MLGLEDDAHAAGPEPVEHQVVADDQPLRLALEDRRGLVRRQPAETHQLPRHGPGVAQVARVGEPLPVRGGLGRLHQAALGQLVDEIVRRGDDRDLLTEGLRDPRRRRTET